ncbi:GA2L1 protein, partial [Emberiza fucata]|nr:GA2L1 protein [Emberiza fucata]
PRPGPGDPEELARRLRAPRWLEPGQEQRLFQRLEEEFLANTRLLEQLGDAESAPAAPPAAAADSAYCSSSSSSSSLNVFAKHGLPAEEGRRGGSSDGNNNGNNNGDNHGNNNGNNGNHGGCPPLPANPSLADARRRSTFSSSSDESCCFPASWDNNRDTPGNPGSDTDWATGEDELMEMEESPGPGVPAAPPRPWAKPRLDTQPHRAPSRIPTPQRAPNGSARAWGALQGAPCSLLEREGLEENAWP